MEYVPLGNDGTIVSRVAFGCEPLGGTDWGSIDIAEVKAAAREAYESGITLFDTADVYGLGRSETRLSEALGDARTKVIIATKGGLHWRSSTSHSRASIHKDNSPKAITQSVEASLRRLRVDQIGLYQIHWPDGRTAVEDTVEALLRCVEAGKIRNLGCSNVGPDELRSAYDSGARASVQMSFNLLHQASAPTFDVAVELGMATLAYGCLAQGLLTGKFRGGEAFGSNDRRSRLSHFTTEDHSVLINDLRTAATRLTKTPSQLALRWVLDVGRISCAVVGIKSRQQLRENLGAVGWVLRPCDLRFLNG
jgi:aryl-alcohol dehydrogenase-like predicted oxidoreductase